MARQHLLTVFIAGIAACSGCAATRPCSADFPVAGPGRVTVLFATPPGPVDPATIGVGGENAELAFDRANAGLTDDGYLFASSPVPEPALYHVVMWGEAFNGQDVTYSSAALSAGQYTFGMFDHERDASYQGWISVNGGGDSVLDVLTDWRDTVHEQEEWLGFENRTAGKFFSRNPKEFKEFSKQLRRIRGLESRINSAIQDEINARFEQGNLRAEILNGTEILMMPGAGEFFRPSTRPTFSDADLASVASNEPITKVVLLADYSKAVEKLRRLQGLRGDLKQCRVILDEERERLRRYKRFLTITDHLYHHDKKFVENEMRLQNAQRLMKEIDNQLNEHWRQSLALAFIAGLSAPHETFDTFDSEERALQRDLVVLREKMNIVDIKFQGTSERNRKRVTLQRQRQELLARIEAVEAQVGQVSEAALAFGKLKESTKVIHRHGPARVITATLVTSELPGYIADAIERESLMTVRLQSTDSMYTPPSSDLALTRGRGGARTVSSR